MLDIEKEGYSIRKPVRHEGVKPVGADPFIYCRIPCIITLMLLYSSHSKHGLFRTALKPSAAFILFEVSVQISEIGIQREREREKEKSERERD